MKSRAKMISCRFEFIQIRDYDESDAVLNVNSS